MSCVPKHPAGNRNLSLKPRRKSSWLLSVVVAYLAAGCSTAPSILAPKSGEAGQVVTLTWGLFLVAAVVFITIIVLISAAYIRSRRLTTDTVITDTNDRRPITLILLAGAVLPAVILFGMMIWSISIDQSVEASASADAPVIEVIGHQWWWEVRYPQQNVVTANEIHIPVGQTVTIKLTSADVNHSFWVPQLAPKLDLIPGQTNTMTLAANQPGTYRGQCAEYCGLQHAHMAFLVIADPPETYTRWIAQQQQAAADPSSNQAQQGQQVFLSSACVACHTIDGTTAAGTLGPNLTHLASRTTIGAGLLPNTPGNLAGWIVNSQALKPGNLMPPMALDPDQVQALLAYLETLE